MRDLNEENLTLTDCFLSKLIDKGMYYQVRKLRKEKIENSTCFYAQIKAYYPIFQILAIKNQH